MKKIVSAFVVFILLASALGMFTTTAGYKNSVIDVNVIKVKPNDNTIFEKNEIVNNINDLKSFFTENQGQVDSLVEYYMVGKGIWLLEDGVVFDIKEPIKEPRRNVLDKFSTITDPEPQLGVRFKLNFVNSNKVKPQGIDVLPSKSNFFYGNEPDKWCTDVPNYQRIIYENIYNKIDLVYYNTADGLKYDFIIHPGGNPADIVLKYEGIDTLDIDNKGDLIIRTAVGNLKDEGLFIYQSNDNGETVINGNFKLFDSTTYGFMITGNYDPNLDLVIDPALDYSTYIGGSGMDMGYAIEVDSAKNMYVCGYTASDDFDTTTGAYQEAKSGSSGNDAFAVKINPQGNGVNDLVWATYLGGTGNEQCYDLALDSSNNVYLTGITYSTSFPTAGTPYDTVSNGGGDTFCSKISSNGQSLLYSTYYGGSNVDNAYSIALDSSNNMYVTGHTSSNTTLPTTAGCYQSTGDTGWGYDVFFAKISTAGGGSSDLMYSTYLGGSAGTGGMPGSDQGYAITVDTSGNAYITGTTWSSDFDFTANAFKTTISGQQDAFISKINPAGSGTSDLVYSTYVGGGTGYGGTGTAMQTGYGIALDSNNHVVITGKTDATNFYTSTNAYQSSFSTGASSWEADIFVFKINPTGSTQPSYSSYLGGNFDDCGYDIEIDSLDYAYIAGTTGSYSSSSNTFPVTPTAYDKTFNGGNFDAVVCKISTTSNSLPYASYLGGSIGWDYGYGIAYDADYKMYATGYNSGDFPNTTGAYDQSFNKGYQDAFATRLEFNNLPIVVDLNVSCVNVWRTNSVYVYANGTDVEDLESALTPTFQFKHNSVGNWQNYTNDPTNITTANYNNNRWWVTVNFPASADIGWYDFSVEFVDTGSMLSGPFILAKGMYLHNNLPNLVVPLPTLSKNTAKKNEEVSVIVNAEDIEDAESELAVTVEYRDPTDYKWNISYINTSAFKGIYVGGQWMVNITVPFGKTYDFGTFDFRVNVSDIDNGFTGWYYLYDQLTITNDAPVFIDVGLSTYSILRTNSVYLYSNCSDFETPEHQLTYSAQYKHSSDSDWTDLTDSAYATDRWRTTFETDTGSKLGEYSFRVKFEDNMGLSTDWQEIDTMLTVLNNKPYITYGLEEIEVGFDPITITLSDYENDVEDDHLHLNWSVPATTYYYLESVEIIDIELDRLKLTPKLDVDGEEDITLILTDKDGGTVSWTNLTIIVESTITYIEPEVTLVSPLNDVFVTEKRPTLEWDLYNPDEFDVNFTVYLDENPNPTTVRATGLTSMSYKLEEDLENEKTYYWYIAPSFGIGPLTPWNFTVKLGYQKIYGVNLTSEDNILEIKQGSKGHTNLTVKNLGNVADTIDFELTSKNFKQTYLKLNKSSLQLASLETGWLQLEITPSPSYGEGWYMIMVTAKSKGNISQTDSVNIWVNVISKFDLAEYNVTIEVYPLTKTIKQGESGTVSLIIKNLGNQIENFEVDYQSLDFVGTSIVFENKTFTLGPGETKTVQVTINIPESMATGPYTITFQVNSTNSIDKTEELVVTVEEKSSPGPETPDNGDGNKTDDKDDDNTMMVAGVSLVIIIIIILIVAMMVLRKKKEEEYLKQLEEEETGEERVGLGEGDQQPPMEPPAPDTGELPMAQPMPVEPVDETAAPQPESPSVRVEPTPVQEYQQPVNGYYQEPAAEGYYQQQAVDTGAQPEYEPTPTPVVETAAPAPPAEPSVAQPVDAKKVE
jgi:hypothetical protein